MKKLIIITIILIAGGTAGFGQHALVSAYAETTVSGAEYGAGVAFESKSMWGLGGFLQQGFQHVDENTSPARFYGLHLHAPVARDKKLAFFATLRTGLVNDKFVVVVPGFETRMNVSGRLTASVGGAMRKGYPSLSARIGFRIF